MSNNPTPTTTAVEPAGTYDDKDHRYDEASYVDTEGVPEHELAAARDENDDSLSLEEILESNDLPVSHRGPRP